MKKIIATALSILVGAFGYTIVDSSVENRISSLEKQVASLQAYHTIVDTYESTADELSTYDSSSAIQTTKPILSVGYKKNWNLNASVSKFLIRVYTDDSVCAYSPETLNAIEESTMTDSNAHKEIADEYYLYVTEAYSEIEKVTEKETTTRVEYDDNFSTTIHSDTYNVEYSFVVKIKGYTDKALEGREISNFYCAHNSTFNLEGNAKINNDGTFEFVSIEQEGYFNRDCKIISMNIK